MFHVKQSCTMLDLTGLDRKGMELKGVYCIVL